MTCSRIPSPLGPAETLQANGIPWRGPSGGTRGDQGGPSGTISGDQWVTHGGTIFVLYAVPSRWGPGPSRDYIGGFSVRRAGLCPLSSNGLLNMSKAKNCHHPHHRHHHYRHHQHRHHHHLHQTIHCITFNQETL